MTKKNDPIGVIEAAYRIELPELEWLQGIAGAAQPLLDDGFGLNTYLYERLADGNVNIWSPVLAGGDPVVFATLAGVAMEASKNGASQLAQTHAGIPCNTASSVLGGPIGGGFEERLGPLGVRDVLGVVGADPTGFGCGIIVPRRRRGKVSKALMARWSRVSAHLTNAYRARRAANALPVRAEAILDPNGALQEAMDAAKETDARAALRDAAIALDRARGALRRDDPDGAVDLWKGLVVGRWSLVDHFDSDGRRFLIARPNDADTGQPSGVSPRERQVLGYRALGHSLKLIAYELGLSVGTVSKELDRAMKTLGLSNENEIAPLLRPRRDV
jgi:DNA-binding CsgD family transcriptional regulator